MMNQNSTYNTGQGSHGVFQQAYDKAHSTD